MLGNLHSAGVSTDISTHQASKKERKKRKGRETVSMIIVTHDGIVLPNGDVVKEVDKEGYTYLGVVELDKIKENEMKEKTTKECKR